MTIKSKIASISTSFKNDGIVDDEPKVSTRKSLGYVEGYDKYTSKSGGGGLLTNNFGFDREKEVDHGTVDINKKGMPVSTQVNKQVEKFRNIGGFSESDTYGTSDNIEDPTFIIFDLHLDVINSPLFTQVDDFFDNYSSSIPELKEREVIYNEFTKTIKKIFPCDYGEGDGINETGNKRHYINSISGLDNLFKKIVNYPEDLLSFVISEDITMFSQYLAELYNNLVYSYETHRYLIPENLLRFNLTIFFRDVREMKRNSSTIEEDMSKFSYVLHDCQFDFFNSRNFTDSIQNGGFEGGATTAPATLSFNMNYKSVSKITTANLIDNNQKIDLRERDVNDGHGRYNNDYQSQFEYEEAEEKIKANGLFSSEIADIRNIIVNRAKTELTSLAAESQIAVSNKIFGSIGLPGFQNITLTKINVYYDTPVQALDSVSNLFDDFLDDTIDTLKDNITIDSDFNVTYDDNDGIFLDELIYDEYGYPTKEGKLPNIYGVTDEDISNTTTNREMGNVNGMESTRESTKTTTSNGTDILDVEDIGNIGDTDELVANKPIPKEEIENLYEDDTESVDKDELGNVNGITASKPKPIEGIENLYEDDTESVDKDELGNINKK